MNRNVIATIGHSEYKDVFFKAKIIKCELTKSIRFLLPCFDDKIYIQNNECDGLALGYQS